MRVYYVVYTRYIQRKPELASDTQYLSYVVCVKASSHAAWLHTKVLTATRACISKKRARDDRDLAYCMLLLAATVGIHTKCVQQLLLKKIPLSNLADG